MPIGLVHVLRTQSFWHSHLVYDPVLGSASALALSCGSNRLWCLLFLFQRQIQLLRRWLRTDSPPILAAATNAFSHDIAFLESGPAATVPGTVKPANTPAFSSMNFGCSVRVGCLRGITVILLHGHLLSHSLASALPAVVFTLLMHTYICFPAWGAFYMAFPAFALPVFIWYGCSCVCFRSSSN